MILKDDTITNNSKLFNQVKQINSQKIVAYGFIIFVILFIVVGIYSIFLLKTPLVNKIVDSIPIEWEEKGGNEIFKMYKKNLVLDNRKEVDSLLSLITTPLLDNIDSEYEFKFHIVKNEQINAFALPGGNVVINTGLISVAKRPEEVIGVLAHEIAHVTQKHGLEQLINSIGLYTVIQLFFGDVTGFIAVIIDNGSFFINQQFSQEHEREADLVGLDYLLKSNIDPTGLVDFFKILKQEKEEESKINSVGVDTNKVISEMIEKAEKKLSFLSTHPATEDRISYIQKEIEKLDYNDKYYSFNIDDFKRLQSLLENNEPSIISEEKDW